MSALARPATRRRRHGVLHDPQVRVGLVAAVALAVEALLTTQVLDVKVYMLGQTAALWVWIAYKLSRRRDRRSEIVADIAIVAVTAAVLLAYAF